MNAPGPDADLPLDVARQLDARSDAFEKRLRDGERPRIEDFLEGFPEQYLGHLLAELICLEVGARRQAGEQPDQDEYTGRFPEQPEAVRKGFRLLETDGASTQDFSPTENREPGDDPLPELIGPYRIVRRLGQGGFGVVYHAQNAQGEDVAIKVMRDKWRRHAKYLQVRELFQQEAEKCLTLRHPNIVRVLGVHEDHGRLYIVQEFIDGWNLSQFARQVKLSPEQVAELLLPVVEAVGYIHQQGLYHRDLKPDNILIDKSQRPRVADFGLAMPVAERWIHEGKDKVAGTYLYMPPEQLAGHTNLMNASSDIWSVGVIFYELLTGERPFGSATTRGGKEDGTKRLKREIYTREPRGPREIDETIPAELQRICLKCLAKQRSQRYPSAADLRDELSTWRQAPAAQHGYLAEEMPVVDSRLAHKGLAAYTKEDADIFLSLLPGPFDRDGLPPTIGFWKSRIESTDPEVAFRVGVMYGVSGCGKSSLLQAGLLSHLGTQVLAIYIRATADKTEVELLTQLRQRIPDLGRDGSTMPPLPECLARLRDGDLLPPRRKVLLVLDQFEQWLHAHRREPVTQLIEALRHCDGVRVQALVCVRDGFMVSVNRFLRALELEVDGERNYRMVDLFEKPHAHKVLKMLGQAHRKVSLPPTPEQEQFLEQVVERLTEKDGRVPSIQLVVVASIMKSYDWVPAELDRLGGVEAIGWRFLQESFEGRGAPELNRLHQDAAARVLEELLPPLGEDIKRRCSLATIRRASRYGEKEEDQANFTQLMRILEHDLRLITPVESHAEILETAASETPSFDAQSVSSDGEGSYQLTHDFLVQAVRDWIDLRDGRTRQGRARRILRQRALGWSAENEPDRQLPSGWESLRIALLTRRADWNRTQRKMMRRAGIVHGLRIAAVLLLAAGLSWGGYELRGRYLAGGAKRTLLSADAARLPDALAEAEKYRRWVEPDLKELSKGNPETSEQKAAQLHARMFLVAKDAELVPPLVEALLEGPVAYVGIIRTQLEPFRSEISRDLWRMLRDNAEETTRRFRAGLALAGFAADSDEWQPDDLEFLARELVASVTEEPQRLRDYLRPIHPQLLGELEKIFRDPGITELEQVSAAHALVDYAADDIPRLARLLTLATPGQFAILYPPVSFARDPEAQGFLGELVRQTPAEDVGVEERISLGRRRAAAAIALLRQGERESIFNVFRVTDDPESLTQFVHRCSDRGVSPGHLLECVKKADVLRQGKTGAARRMEDRVLFGLLLSLGEFQLEELPETERPAFIEQLADWYGEDPSSAIHGATGWLLRNWGEGEMARNIEEREVPYSPDREWFTLEIKVGTAGMRGTDSGAREPTFYMTFVVIRPGEYEIGSGEDEPARARNELRHKVRINRPYAVLDREITFLELETQDPGFASIRSSASGGSLDSAAAGPHWYEAVLFSRWLTERVWPSNSEAFQAYSDPDSLDPLQFPPDEVPAAGGAPLHWPVDLEKPGFRLPTEAEWEIACRAGMGTAFGFGNDEGHLERYGWFQVNSGRQLQSPRERRPNLWGLFDMHGNVFEWCHDWYGDYPAETPGGATTGSFRVVRGGGWGDPAADCRSASRYGYLPTYRGGGLGFRLALVPGSSSQEPASGGESGSR